MTEKCENCLSKNVCRWCENGTGKNLCCADDFPCPEQKDKDHFIKVPCKVGDIVYTIFEGDIEAIKVTYTKTEESAEFVYRYYDARNNFLNMPFSDRSIGKTVFLTKEEAEEKLKECDNNAR